MPEFVSDPPTPNRQLTGLLDGRQPLAQESDTLNTALGKHPEIVTEIVQNHQEHEGDTWENMGGAFKDNPQTQSAGMVLPPSLVPMPGINLHESESQ